ncbi:TPA: hypothetical protein DEG21_00625 [Patescibacteria group bacterium]|nr:hypothetical protein [Candidatus Gracilibacteria bacterium]
MPSPCKISLTNLFIQKISCSFTKIDSIFSIEIPQSSDKISQMGFDKLLCSLYSFCKDRASFNCPSVINQRFKRHSHKKPVSTVN